jgi:hypothetical protein
VATGNPTVFMTGHDVRDRDDQRQFHGDPMADTVKKLARGGSRMCAARASYSRVTGGDRMDLKASVTGRVTAWYTTSTESIEVHLPLEGPGQATAEHDIRRRSHHKVAADPRSSA